MIEDVDRRGFGDPSFPGIASAPFADGVVLHDSVTGRLFFINATAGLIWHELQRGRDEHAAAAALALAHGIESGHAARDVHAFVQALDEAGLLCEAEGDDPALPALPSTAPMLDRVFCIGERPTRVICHDDDVAESFAALAAPAVVGGDSDSTLTLFRVDDDYCLLRDGHLLQRLATAPLARWALVRELVRGGRARSWLALLHAGALATADGALLIAGDSGAGKSTLLAALLASGLDFIADDIAPIEAGTHHVWPVPLAVSIKQGSWETISALFPELLTRPAIRFGTRIMRYLTPPNPAADAGYPLAAVIFPQYRPGAPLAIERLSSRDSLVLLGEGGSVLPDSDRGLAAFLALWQEMPVYRATYGQLEEAVGAIAGLLGDGRGGGRCRTGGESVRPDLAARAGSG